jgi:hypothetical protein
MPFKKGQSGNPKGREPGKAVLLAGELRKVVSADAKAIVESIVKEAKAGDVESRRAFIRLLPQSKWPTPFTLPKISNPADLPQAVMAVLEAAANGDLSLEDAERVVGLIAGLRQAFEGASLATRLDDMAKQLDVLTGRVGPLP